MNIADRKPSMVIIPISINDLKEELEKMFLDDTGIKADISVYCDDEVGLVSVEISGISDNGLTILTNDVDYSCILNDDYELINRYLQQNFKTNNASIYLNQEEYLALLENDEEINVYIYVNYDDYMKIKEQ
ncbi:MAG: hypothetical protein ACOCRK_03685 [bacterium]